jgi:hypothetical protein
MHCSEGFCEADNVGPSDYFFHLHIEILKRSKILFNPLSTVHLEKFSYTAEFI